MPIEALVLKLAVRVRRARLDRVFVCNRCKPSEEQIVVIWQVYHSKESRGAREWIFGCQCEIHEREHTI